MKQKPYWIKERDNPQLGIYFVACGQMPVKEARDIEKGSLYGSNTMHRFDSLSAYESKLDALREAGEKVQGR